MFACSISDGKKGVVDSGFRRDGKLMALLVVGTFWRVPSDYRYEWRAEAHVKDRLRFAGDWGGRERGIAAAMRTWDKSSVKC